MKGIMGLFILFSLLFIYERKAINILIAYIGVTISLAIIIANDIEIRLIEGEYISYILILVQVSALTILFGFIIMLFPTLNPLGVEGRASPLPSPLSPGVGVEGVQGVEGGQGGKGIKLRYFLTTLAMLGIVITLLYTPLPLSPVSGIASHLGTPGTLGIEAPDTDIHLLRKIGEALYTCDITILKLILVTTILLVAIIGLFFLISL